MEENPGPERTAAPHASRCPNGHEVPSWRSTCGVCGATPDLAGGDAAPAPGAGLPGGGSSGPSKLAWASLAVLGVAAIALPLTREPVLLQDDFTTPEVLRTWPDDGAMVAYADGEYRVSVTTAGGFPYAVRELPGVVSGLAVSVRARVDAGNPVVAVDCVSELVEVSDEAVEETAYYTFMVDPGADRFFIGVGEEPLDQGRITGEVEDGVVAECVHDGSATHLTLRVGDGEAVEVVDPGGLATFRAISLGAYAEEAGAVVAFDDLRVVEGEA